MMKNLGVVFLPAESRLDIAFDTDKVDALLMHIRESDETVTLDFQVWCVDDFNIYTQMAKLQENTQRHFKVDLSKWTDSQRDESIKISHEEWAGDKDIIAIDEITDKRFIASKVDVFNGFFFSVSIAISAEFIIHLLNQSEEMKCHSMLVLAFQAPQYKWKYHVMSLQMKEHDLFIVDATGKVMFASNGIETLADGTETMTFISTTALPMSDKYDHSFQLKRKEGNRDITLLKHLPHPSTKHAIQRIVDGHVTRISELYVNY